MTALRASPGASDEAAARFKKPSAIGDPGGDAARMEGRRPPVKSADGTSVDTGATARGQPRQQRIKTQS